MLLTCKLNLNGSGYDPVDSSFERTNKLSGCIKGCLDQQRDRQNLKDTVQQS